MTQTVTTLANGDKQVVITGTGENWVIPADWNDNANKFEVYGIGGNGANGTATTGGGGGASGGYQSVSNFPLKRYTLTANYNGDGNIAVQNSITTTTSGGTIYPFSVVIGDDGSGNSVYSGVPLGFSGGNASGVTGGVRSFQTYSSTQFVCTTSATVGATYSTPFSYGSSGGTARSSTTAGGAGGAGAAGPNGAGGIGAAGITAAAGGGGGGGNGGSAGTAGSSSTGGAGGTAGTDAGAGGKGGNSSTSGTVGGNGTNTATSYVFSGGGGGGAGDGLTVTSGGAGGLYGAGGGGGASSLLSTGGAGAIGAVIITYTPLATTSKGNMFLMF